MATVSADRGASRDITDLVQATEAQNVPVSDVNHRVKNKEATVQ